MCISGKAKYLTLFLVFLFFIFSPLVSGLDIETSAEDKNIISINLNFNSFDDVGINKTSDDNYPGYWLFVIQGLNRLRCDVRQ